MMPWSKLDDGLDEHAKVDALLDDDELRGLAAVGLWALTLANSARRLTDGKVSTRALKKLAPKHGQGLAQMLAEVGLYDENGGFEIHDYLEFNPSRAAVRAKRAKDAERKAAGRSTRSPNGIHADSSRTDGRTPDGIHEGVRKESARPVPVPVPVPKEEEEEGGLGTPPPPSEILVSQETPA